MRRAKAPAVMAAAGVAALVLGLAVCALLFRPGIFGISVYRVSTSSMSPGIPAGSAAYVSASGGADVLPGDVVVYEDGSGRDILHRVVGKNADGRLVLKGDANPAPDPEPVDPGAVAGRMLAAFPDAGALGGFLAFAAAALGCAGTGLAAAAWGLSKSRKYDAHSAGKE